MRIANPWEIALSGLLVGGLLLACPGASEPPDQAPPAQPPGSPELDLAPEHGSFLPTWYPDADCDGFGDADAAGVTGGDRPHGFVPNALDCDDADPWLPLDERHCDGRGNDCDDAEQCALDAGTHALLSDVVALTREVTGGRWAQSVVDSLTLALPAGGCPATSGPPLDAYSFSAGDVWVGPCSSNEGSAAGTLSAGWTADSSGAYASLYEAAISGSGFTWTGAGVGVEVDGAVTASWTTLVDEGSADGQWTWAIEVAGLDLTGGWSRATVTGSRTLAGRVDVDSSELTAAAEGELAAIGPGGTVRVAFGHEAWSAFDLDQGRRACELEPTTGAWTVTLPGAREARLVWDGASGCLSCLTSDKFNGTYLECTGCDGCADLTLDGVHIGPWCPTGSTPGP